MKIKVIKADGTSEVINVCEDWLKLSPEDQTGILDNQFSGQWMGWETIFTSPEESAFDAQFTNWQGNSDGSVGCD